MTIIEVSKSSLPTWDYGGFLVVGRLGKDMKNIIKSWNVSVGRRHDKYHMPKALLFVSSKMVNTLETSNNLSSCSHDLIQSDDLRMNQIGVEISNFKPNSDSINCLVGFTLLRRVKNFRFVYLIFDSLNGYEKLCENLFSHTYNSFTCLFYMNVQMRSRSCFLFHLSERISNTSWSEKWRNSLSMCMLSIFSSFLYLIHQKYCSKKEKIPWDTFLIS